MLTIYECASWAVVAQFGVATQDLADLAWSPDGSCLAVWDSPAYSYTGLLEQYGGGNIRLQDSRVLIVRAWQQMG